ncbi:alpha/beta hydrolase [Thioalkalivibrio sp. ALJT]|uniref:alpha/beta hydrolase n=1 Tax=Thioalkalivibrio sp. ALJT TaxID=1158146 RepID=UPI00036A2654|nr:alpha/beta hydrolase [Thioalkalivibrio sp. ALJT]
MKLLFLLPVAFAFLSACATHRNAPAETVTFETTGWHKLANQTYSPSGWPETLNADVYLPDREGARPAVLLVHGGGWQGRSRDDMEAIAERLAASGVVAVNIDYRFAPQYRFPAQLHDLQVAMHWLHENAELFSVDTGRIGAMGYSAGGHLVSLLGLVAGQGGELDSPHGGERTRPVAVVAGGTPSDLRKFPGGRLVPEFLGGTLQEHPERFAAASPVTHVHAGAPAFFLYHGQLDWLVPVDHATDFYEALQAANVDSELYLLPLRGHATTFLVGRGAVTKGMGFLHRQLEAAPMATAREGSR